jgi:formylglycine-generating enzyme required for sulfatase activity
MKVVTCFVCLLVGGSLVLKGQESEERRPGISENIINPQRLRDAEALDRQLHLKEQQLTSEHDPQEQKRLCAEILDWGTDYVKAEMNPRLADDVALEFSRGALPPPRARSYLTFWVLRASAAVQTDSRTAGEQAADVLTALGARIMPEASVQTIIEKLRHKEWLVSPGKLRPSNATASKPVVNSLGMKFVPVEVSAGPSHGMLLLFSTYETRIKDYAIYARANPGCDNSWMESKVSRQWGHKEPKYPLTTSDNCPVVLVSWDGAVRFCEWLTQRERRNGLIGHSERYRLPTDHEWSCAVGIGAIEDSAADPLLKSCLVKRVYPWGIQWPPPKGSANLADETFASVLGVYGPIVHVTGYKDGFAATAPVGSFHANRLGLYDMAGNVHEWCLDIAKIDEEGIHRVGRGSCYRMAEPESLLSSYRKIGGAEPHSRDPMTGFRVVLVAERISETRDRSQKQEETKDLRQ